MHLTSSILWAVVVLLLLSMAEMRRAGRGKGLKGVRNGLARDRWRGNRRHGRSDAARLLPPNCTESLQSRDVFLDCQERGLISIPSSRSWSKEPKHLLLARNRIRILRDGAFAGFEGLKSLDLQQNQISVVEEEAFRGLWRLKTLLLQHNKLAMVSEEALIPMPNLQYLRLYDNPWNCGCTLESLVQTLQVPSNRHLANHARCTEPLRLKGKKLKQVDTEFLCQDSDQGPQDDQTDPSEPGKPSGIQGKPDATVSCHAYLYPEPRLDCSRRDLTEVPSGIPDYIVHMDLSHNSIRQLRARDFHEARSLRTLNLKDNDLEHMEKGSLSGLLHLHEMDLSDNNLHFVQHGVLEDLYFLSLLKLGGNPWVCNYSIHYMVYWLRLHPGVRMSGLQCRSPVQHMGERVEKYVDSYYRGCPKEAQRSQVEHEELGDTDPELWESLLEVQGTLEENPEPSHLRGPQKYQIIRLS
ncbi:leucine-rich repeat-containing protein 17 [Gadus morhua]|uniref:Leucine rich repeat containing 17 n=1 Tax=Gadus morhua TaxID=8049 RepID=A0A8C4ZQM4_GADMO|nr:leucine-rich repeat-containing protein 17 [Gadus morhua]